MAVAAACAGAVLALPAQAAFIVDQVQVRRAGDDAVLELQFDTEVSFLRLIATASGDTVFVAYQLVATTNREVGPGSQLLSLDHVRGLDRVRLTDEPAQGDRERRLVLRMGTASTVRARAGRDSRRLEIVLVGQGAGLGGDAPAAAAALPAATEPRAEALLAQGRARLAAGDAAGALEVLGALLELPPNAATAPAQELAGAAWEALRETARARAEYETYLRLYPQGEGAARVRERLAALPAAADAPPQDASPGRAPGEETTLDASAAVTWYGGNGRLRSQEFQDSPISGLPPVAGEPQFSDDRTSQLINSVDIHWRRRSREVDQRFVFRDAYTADLDRPDDNRNRLSSLYVEHRALKDGWGGRLGRQSPTGGGIQGRFDGVQAYVMRGRDLKFEASAGRPAEPLFDTRRWFAGARVDGERLIGNFGAGLYAIEQRIDGETDRRALGLDLRWYDGGSSMFGQLDYDIEFRAVNVASVLGTHVTADNTVWTMLYDRRALSTLSVGNALTFEDPTRPGVIFRTLRERAANTTLEALRRQIRSITPMVTQAQLGVTRPLSEHWTTGASLQLSNTGAIPPVPDVPGFETGRPATGDLLTASAQLIGLNLFSDRDTHVGSVSVIRGALLDGIVVSYNHSSYPWPDWQLEPSLQYYTDRMGSARSRRWTPGLRLTYRGWKRLALEAAVLFETGTATRATLAADGSTVTTRERADRASYVLGARLEF